MFLLRPNLYFKSLHFSSLTTPTTKPSSNWRTQIKQTHLVSQISSILLQRTNWPHLLISLNLSTKLTPHLFLQILHKTQSNPQVSLYFFNWAKNNLGFQADLRVECKLAQTLIRFGLSQPARPILDSLIQAHPPTQIVDSLVVSCTGTDCHSVVLSSVVDCYSKNGLFLEALEVLRKVKDFGYVVSDYSCNGLLNLLQESNEIGLFWCFYASMLRNGVLVSQFTWSVVARCLSKDGNFEKIGQVIDMGVCNSLMYNLVIEGYSRRGDFGASSHRLSEMVDKKLEPGFGTYSSILDGACQHKYVEMIEVIIDSMVKNGYIPKLPLSEYDSVIQKLSNAGKTYAAELFFDRASDEKVKLNDVTYECMLRAFSREGRVKDAIMIHDKMLERGTVANCSCYTLFLNVLCKEDPTEKISELLKDIIERGFFPSLSELSKYIISQCKNRRWREAEDLLTRILEKGYVPDPFCSSSLIKHYCSSRQIDSAIDLHHRLEHLKEHSCTQGNSYGNILSKTLNYLGGPIDC
ncbi:pentatricopeptide repeat-containing protein At4g21170-like isoform X2 [Apium graveolens]|uniref:pentatricopeptide repeat-containing protein At4g21170-like isoform X2 n=1 Tax=Apium graveolens TaxID=4045 RepID=UPI003D7A2C1B